MAKVYKVYGLREVGREEFRYVGLTSQTIKTRLKQHLQPSFLKTNTYKNHWIKRCKRSGIEIETVLLRTYKTLDGCNKGEVFYIRKYRKLGHRLTNGTDGGDGRVGAPHTEATRAKISKAHKGKKFSAESIAKRSKTNKGKKRSAESRAKMSVSKSKPVWQKNKNTGKRIKKWASATQAAKHDGFNSCNISDCCNNKRKSHGGFKWAFA